MVMKVYASSDAIECVSICPLPWELVVDCRLDVSAYLPPREMRSKLPDSTELL